MTRHQPKWPTTPSPQYIRKRSSARYTKGQRKGEACVDKLFKTSSVYEATFFETSISAVDLRCNLSKNGIGCVFVWLVICLFVCVDEATTPPSSIIFYTIISVWLPHGQLWYNMYLDYAFLMQAKTNPKTQPHPPTHPPTTHPPAHPSPRLGHP